MRRRAGPARLRHHVGDMIQRQDLWPPGARVAVAVSGGLDSMCLLDLLVATAAWHRAELEVVTVDHGIHPLSEAHATFVSAHAEERGLRCAVGRLALGAEASEARARAARHAFFATLPVDRVATGHHRDDQAETVLLQLLRGAGARGLAAMGWRRDALVRPLLRVPRAALVDYATHLALPWVDDPTNASDRYLRNRVRREAMPVLERLRPESAAALARAAELLGADDALLEALVDADPGAQPTAAGWDAAWIGAAPPSLVGRAIQRFTPTISLAQVDDVRACARRGSGVVRLEGGAALVVGRSRVRLTAADDGSDPGTVPRKAP